MRKYVIHAWRIACTFLGIGAGALGCFGAYEFALKLEGHVSYLVVAAPVVAAFAALIPPIAEATWRSRAYVKSLFWWLILIPAAAVVFFSAAERVHVAKSGAQAERAAYHSAADRARANLAQVKAEAAEAQAKADKTMTWKKCGPECNGLRATAETKASEVVKAEAALLAADKLTRTEAPLQAPVWLLPMALDLVTFMAIWTGLSGPWRERREPPVKKPAKRRLKKRKVTVKVPKRAAPLANDNNVVPFAG